MKTLSRRIRLIGVITGVVSLLGFGIAQALVPVDSTVTASDLRSGFGTLNEEVTKTTLFVNNTSNTFYLTDLVVALNRFGNPTRSGFGLDVITFYITNGSTTRYLDDVSFMLNYAFDPPATNPTTQTVNLQSGIVVPQGYLVKAILNKSGAGEGDRGYKVAFHGHY